MTRDPAAGPTRRRLVAGAASLAGLAALPRGASAAMGHALAMHGSPAYPADIDRLPYADPGSRPGGTIRLARIGAFDTVMPFQLKGRPAAELDLVHLGLMQRALDEPFTLYPQVAAGAEMDDSRAWVRFRLDPAARFADGAPVTADDVLASRAWLAANGRANQRLFYRTVSEAVAEDGGTVLFRFAGEGNRELPLILALLAVLPRRALDEGRFHGAGGLDPAALPGTGPYTIETVDPGRRIVYRRRRPWWGDASPWLRLRYAFDRVIVDYYRDDAAARAALESGELDLWLEADPASWESLARSPAARRPAGAPDRLVLRDEPVRGPVGLKALALNMRRPPLDDRRIRLALNWLYDFPWVNRTLLHDSHARSDSLYENTELEARGPASGAEAALLAPFGDAVPPPGDPPWSPPTLDGTGRDRAALGRALALFRDAGWRLADGVLTDSAGRRPGFEMLLADPEEVRRLGLFRETLGRLGIAVRVRLVDSAEYQARITGYDFDMMVALWGQTLSPGTEQAYYWGSAAADAPGSRNYPGIRDPAVDALVARLAESRSRPELVAAARALDRVVRARAPFVPLSHRKAVWTAHAARLRPPAAEALYGLDWTWWWEGA